MFRIRAVQVGTIWETLQAWQTCCLLKSTIPSFLVTQVSVSLPSLYFGVSDAHESLFIVVTEQVVGGILVPLSKRLIACLGVDDLVIVDTPDALLVTTRARSQDLKKLVTKCRESGWKTVL